jgi:hypothetical protein
MTINEIQQMVRELVRLDMPNETICYLVRAAINELPLYHPEPDRV